MLFNQMKFSGLKTADIGGQGIWVSRREVVSTDTHDQCIGHGLDPTLSSCIGYSNAIGKESPTSSCDAVLAHRYRSLPLCAGRICWLRQTYAMFLGQTRAVHNLHKHVGVGGHSCITTCEEIRQAHRLIAFFYGTCHNFRYHSTPHKAGYQTGITFHFVTYYDRWPRMECLLL